MSTYITPDLLVTLWPSFPHFKRFATDDRVSAIRLNSAMMSLFELDKELDIIQNVKTKKPLLYDIKGRQMRITSFETNSDGNLEITLNHPISVVTPCVVLFKAGADCALLNSIKNNGYTLVFEGGPRYRVNTGESLHIRDKSFRNLCKSIFSDAEVKKIEKVKGAGFNRYFLSYVEQQSDIDQFQELVGKEAEIWLKIESVAGLNFVAQKFKKQDNLILVAARGDLFVELNKPHDMIKALKLIIDKDPKANVGSRLLLSVIDSPVPSCADLLEIAWLHDIGYNSMMLCDEICLKENLLASSVAVFDGIRHDLK